MNQTPNAECGQLPPDDDASLMMRVRGGDDEAFAELVRRHQKSVMNFFERNGVYRDVEDLAQ